MTARRLRVLALAVAMASGAAGCGHGQAATSATGDATAPQAQRPASDMTETSSSPAVGAAGLPPPVTATASGCDARLGDGGLRRAAVNRTLDAGLGTWLRGVDVDPKLERGRFRGWIVRALPEDVCYSDLELQAGDVVTRINGRGVERPEEAKDIWDGLRTSPTLVIDFLRDGHPRTLRFDILDR